MHITRPVPAEGDATVVVFSNVVFSNVAFSSWQAPKGRPEGSQGSAAGEGALYEPQGSWGRGGRSSSAGKRYGQRWAWEGQGL